MRLKQVSMEEGKKINFDKTVSSLSRTMIANDDTSLFDRKG